MKKKKILTSIWCALFLTFGITNTTSQNIVINEIVTDPQQDWSSNGFNGSPGTNSITNTDEWLELFIKTDGLDLTNWTIELIDGSDIIGNLTDSGAFDVSNYISNNGGTFTSTKNGDFLILGNLTGSAQMSNSITINLKNNIGTIIDTVTLGIAAGEAPKGSADSAANESVQRIPNGTNTDDVDFIKGIASLGKINSTLVWSGSLSNNWLTTGNWTSGSIPIATDNVSIPAGLTNYPTISSGSNVIVNKIVIDSEASLIAEGTATISGNVTYNRTIDFVSGNLKGWYLVGAPVSGQIYNKAYATSHALASSGSKRGIATYTTISDSWSYLLDDNTNAGSFITGKGYSLKKGTATGTISFSGTIHTANAGEDVTLIKDGNRFNALSNPYTAFINSATFLNNENAISETKTLWIWNQTLGTNGAYEVKGVGSNFMIAPGQGFFVKANTAGGIFNFSKANQSHNTGTDTFQKKPTNTQIKISITDGTINQYAKIYYLENATTAFDAGYDGELFRNYPFAVYTQLVTENLGKNYQIQSLSNDNYENTIIPVGVNAEKGKEIMFSAEVSNLPKNLKVFLEDREANTFNRLDEAKSVYKITLTKTLKGIGRFYIHTAQKVLSTNHVSLEKISIYKLDNSTLKIVGLQQEATSITLFNILGKQIMKTSFTANGIEEVSLPKLAKGVYIVQLETEIGKLNKKIILE
ncbi:T9SS type A sorting domain-containing protein [Polaribacter sp. IC073]|uniref:T9SS type A sorting domain-containing protein n=1 Tax=Polaribacter sp. IC073 TaxID=2508540 RepID=UPI0011BF881F|nr:T9SS type A sorting domain-containing protein [Polaribacter sp. IC073]TXD46645.1 T9SS type A sorting domain-containing protein [Polaribacter sp. IC073]